MGKIGLSYGEYENMVDEVLVRLFKLDAHFDGVYGLPRGGLPLAVHISHHLNLPLVMNLIQFSKEHPGGNLLVVDDIVDTGKTFDRLIEVTEIQNITFYSLSLYYKPHSSYTPDMYIQETMSWIVFPWEPFEEAPSEYHQDVYSELFLPQTKGEFDED